MAQTIGNMMVGADTAWILVATALVLFMTLPGLALFYGGLVRSRNVLSVLMQTMSIACLMSLLWLVAGYSVAFGPESSPFWGGMSKVFLNGINADSLRGTLPEVLFFAFQMTFAIITPALIVGAYVERINFTFVLGFSAIWMLMVYAPVTFWMWGGGFLSDGGIFGAIGAKDFAGGIVVHETAGLSSLVIAMFLGPRLKNTVPPHNPGMVMIGASMLWVGWFGFNAGSQLAADGGAAMALVVTHISAATGALSWALYERIRHGKASLLGLATGAIAGLASITPAAGYVGPAEAMFIGAIAGVLTQESCKIVKNWLKIDDTLDVFAVHGVGGIFGTIMIAVFGAGNWIAQIGALLIVGVFTLTVTTLIITLLQRVVSIRVNAEDETNGLDFSAHGERAYDLNS